MKFTEEDIPLMKLIFNPSTHDMGMLVGGERSEEIWGYVSKYVYEYEFFTYHNLREQIKIMFPLNIDVRNSLERNNSFIIAVLSSNDLVDFFWDMKIFDFSLIKNKEKSSWFIRRLLIYSPVAEKILDSKLFNKYIEDESDYLYIEELSHSPIKNKIWESGIINLTYFNEEEVSILKQKFESE